MESIDATMKCIAKSYGYTIPEGVVFSETHLQLPPDLPYEDWVKIGQLIGALGRAIEEPAYDA